MKLLPESYFGKTIIVLGILVLLHTVLVFKFDSILISKVLNPIILTTCTTATVLYWYGPTDHQRKLAVTEMFEPPDETDNVPNVEPSPVVGDKKPTTVNKQKKVVTKKQSNKPIKPEQTPDPVEDGAPVIESDSE